MIKYFMPVLGLAVAADAGLLVVDDFTEGPFSQTLDAGSVVGQQNVGVLGGQRDYAAGVTANPFASDLTVNVNPDVGVSYAAGPGVAGFLVLQYDGDQDLEGDDLPLNPDGGLVIDVSAFTSLDFEFHFLDIPMGVEVQFANVEGGNIVASSSLEMIVDDLAVPTITSFDIGAFTGDADLTQVNAITINFNTQDNAPAARDFVLRDITFIPAPGAASVLAIAGLALTRRRR